MRTRQTVLAALARRLRLRAHQPLQSRGFTLIGLMIVVAVISIPAAIAYPSYTRYVVRSNRAAAEACLYEYANYMERYYTTHQRYAKESGEHELPTLDCASEANTGKNYEYKLTTVTQNEYTLEAAPQDAQEARDTKCGTLSLDQTGKRGVSGTGSVGDCW